MLPVEAVKELVILGWRLLSLKTKMPILRILRQKSKPRKLKFISSLQPRSAKQKATPMK